MADMQELIARLEAAETGSREFDRDIEIAIGGGWIGADEERVYRRDKNGFGYTQAFSTVTTSLDAALALADRVLIEPFGWTINKVVDDGAVLHSAALYASRAYPDYPAARTPALALCIAILKAKAQGEGG